MGTHRNKNSVIAVIPAHNEAETISAVVKGALDHVDDVIVIDDGSRDDTAALAEAAGATVIRLTPNRGKGQALNLGIEQALRSNPWGIVTMDADGEHEPADLPALLAALEEADVALGVRNTYRSGARRVMNHLALFWFRLLSPAIEDTICGLRAFRAEHLPKLQNDYGGFVYEHEVLIRAVVHGLELRAVPIRTSPIVRSHVTLREVLRANNHFDRRILGSLVELPLPLWRKGALAIGCTVGLGLGVPAEKALGGFSRFRARAEK